MSRFPEAINQQIANEFAASQQYVAIAVYYDAETLPGLAAHFYRQSVEERNHAMMLVQYLLDSDEQVAIPGVDAPKTEFGAAVEPAARGGASRSDAGGRPGRPGRRGSSSRRRRALGPGGLKRPTFPVRPRVIVGKTPPLGCYDVNGSPGSVALTVRQLSQVMWRITSVITRPMIGSATGTPSATTAALSRTPRLTKPSTRAWSPSATSAGLFKRLPARERICAAISLPANPINPAAASHQRCESECG